MTVARRFNAGLDDTPADGVASRRMMHQPMLSQPWSFVCMRWFSRFSMRRYATPIGFHVFNPALTRRATVGLSLRDHGLWLVDDLRLQGRRKRGIGCDKRSAGTGHTLRRGGQRA